MTVISDEEGCIWAEVLEVMDKGHDGLMLREWAQGYEDS
jgi:hypothetical protein